VNIVFYTDETGTHSPVGNQQGAEVAGIAGYLSWADDWSVFCEQWKQVLNKYGIKAFHFSEFANLKNGPQNKNWPYRDWPNSRRDDFLNSLAAVATTHTLFSFGCFFNVVQYHQIIPAWYQQRPDHHPYDLCINGFFVEVLTGIGTCLLLPRDAQCAFFFDQSNDPKWQQSIHVIFNGVKSLRDPDHRMGALTFADMRHTLPLQAADMVAYRMRQVLTKKCRGQNTVSNNAFDAALAPEGKKLHILYYEEEQLKILAADLERDKAIIFHS